MSSGDADLLEAARAGSRDAFQQLVQRHQRSVRAFLMRALGNAADADDIAQDTFLAAWTGLWRFRGGSSVRTWLCAIAWKKCLTFTRSQGRMRRREAEADPDMPAVVNPDNRLDALAALQTLGLEQRAAVALCLGAEFSHAEAAEALDLPLGTVKSHIQRGRARLLAALGGQDE